MGLNELINWKNWHYWAKGALFGFILFIVTYILSLFYLGCSGDVYYLCPGDTIQKFLDANFPSRYSLLAQEPILFLILFTIISSLIGFIVGKFKSRNK